MDIDTTTTLSRKVSYRTPTVLSNYWSARALLLFWCLLGIYLILHRQAQAQTDGQIQSLRWNQSSGTITESWFTLGNNQLYGRNSSGAIMGVPFSQFATAGTTLSHYGITDAQPLSSDLTTMAANGSSYYLNRANHTGNIPWSIVSGRPTNLAGYGITDAQPLSSDLTTMAANGASYYLSRANHTGSMPWSAVSSRPTNLSGYGITDAQPLDGTLTALAGLSVSANRGIYATGADTFSTYSLTAAARALLDDPDTATQRATLGLGNVENTALSNWSGSGNLQTLQGVTFSEGNTTGGTNTIMQLTSSSPHHALIVFRASGATSAGFYFGDNTDTGGYSFRGKGEFYIGGDRLHIAATGDDNYANFTLGQAAMLWDKSSQVMTLVTTGHAHPIVISGSHQAFTPFGVEKMRVTSTGVGIGKSIPSEALDIAGNLVVTGRIGAGVGSPLSPIHGSLTDNVTSQASEILRLTHSSNSSVQAGFGVSIGINLEDSSGINRDAGCIKHTWTTNSTDQTQVDFLLMDEGELVEALKVGYGKIIIPNLPTTSAGLASGQLWNDGGTLKIAP